MNHRFVPGTTINRENGSLPMNAAILGCAIKIGVLAVAGQSRPGVAAVSPTLKSVEHCLFIVGKELEYHSAVVKAALIRCTEDGSSPVHDQVAVGTVPIGPSFKAIEHPFVSRRIDLENGSTVVESARFCRAIEIAASVHDQTGTGIGSVVLFRENVKHGQMVGSVDLKDSSFAARPRPSFRVVP